MHPQGDVGRGPTTRRRRGDDERDRFDKFAGKAVSGIFTAWLMPVSPGQRGLGSYTVKGPRHFQFSATRDDVIIECATLLAIMGRYTRRQQRLQRERSSSEARVETRSRDEDGRGPTKRIGASERRREGERGDVGWCTSAR